MEKEKEKPKKDTVFILSLCGGGIRGIISAFVLSRLQQLCGVPLSSVFDLIAGTSTGGILAAALVTPKLPESKINKFAPGDLIGLYSQNGETIFSRPFKYKVQSLWGGNAAKYPSTGLEQLLDEYFGSVRMSETLTELLITSGDVSENLLFQNKKPDWLNWPVRPYFFKTHKAKLNKFRNAFLKHACLATSAAPTYFPPFLYGSKCLIDGGVFANDPSLCALTEAKKLYPDTEKFVVVTIGTGSNTKGFKPAKVKSWGLPGWGKNIIPIMMQLNQAQTRYEIMKLDFHRTDKGVRHFLFDCIIPPGYSDAMDDVSQSNISNLKGLGNQLAEQELEKLIELSNLLKTRSFI